MYARGKKQASVSILEIFTVTSVVGQDFPSALGEQPLGEQSLSRVTMFLSQCSGVSLYDRVGIYREKLFKTV